jgi:hypothetical protein
MDGKRLDIIGMNLAMFGEMDPDMPRISPEIKKICEDALHRAKLNLKLTYSGRPLIFGTGGDIESGTLEELFFKPL